MSSNPTDDTADLIAGLDPVLRQHLRDLEREARDMPGSDHTVTTAWIARAQVLNLARERERLAEAQDLLDWMLAPDNADAKARADADYAAALIAVQCLCIGELREPQQDHCWACNTALLLGRQRYQLLLHRAAIDEAQQHEATAVRERDATRDLLADAEMREQMEAAYRRDVERERDHFQDLLHDATAEVERVSAKFQAASRAHAILVHLFAWPVAEIREGDIEALQDRPR